MVRYADDFASWRQQARILLRQHVSPERIQWLSAKEPHPAGTASPEPTAPICLPPAPNLCLPKAFYAMAEMVACHRDAGRWDLLYRVVYRLAHGEPQLLEAQADRDLTRVHEMEAEVRQDVHKMRAFVRFRAVRSQGGTRHIAWYQPSHHILELNAPFFVRRFSGMGWSILTPARCLHWDGTDLFVTDGCDRSNFARNENLEALWVKHGEPVYQAARLEVKSAARAALPLGDGATGSIEHLVARSSWNRSEKLAA